MKKILIVDDDKDIRKLIEISFRLSGYKSVFEAVNGREGYEKAKEVKPDLIVMDVKMPGELDGIAAVKLLRNDPEMKDSAVLMLSANGQKKEIEAGYKAGADQYFVKPFSPLELIKKAEAVMKKKRKENNRRKKVSVPVNVPVFQNRVLHESA